MKNFTKQVAWSAITLVAMALCIINFYWVWLLTYGYLATLYYLFKILVTIGKKEKNEWLPFGQAKEGEGWRERMK